MSADRPPQPVPVDDPRIDALRLLLGVTDRLLAEDGCPWDREQTEASMAPFVVEEAHELVEAIECETAEDAASEAGDVLGGLMLICRIAEHGGRYDLGTAARAAAEKLTRRHPHVFGDGTVDASVTETKNWEAIKLKEREAKGEAADTSALAGIPKALSAIQRAARTCDKAVGSGFHWTTIQGAFAKVSEELDELTAEIPAALLEQQPGTAPDPEHRERIVAELGDLLLATAYFARYIDLDPEAACRSAIRRFDERYRRMEIALGGTTRGAAMDTLLQAWNAEKANDVSSGT